MKHYKAFFIMIKLLLIFLMTFSYLIILSAAPHTTGSLMKNSKEKPFMFQEHLTSTQEVEDQFIAGNENFEIFTEGFVEGRMDFEKTDYSGVGANPEHDPKPPGKV